MRHPTFARRDAADVRVIDGDKIQVVRSALTFRLSRIQYPETRGAACDAERELGGKATRRLRQIVRTAATLDLQLVPCACSPGTEGTPTCNYGHRSAF